MGSANVLTETGWLEISRIVRKRPSVSVACADPGTGQILFRPVVGWSCRCAPPEYLPALETFARAGNRAERGAHQAIRVSSGHLFHTPEGLRRAGELRRGGDLLTIGTRLEPWQEQVVIGSLLGDGYVASGSTGRDGRLAICHGHDQRSYLGWKHTLLENLVLTPPSLQRLSPGRFARRPTSRFTTRQHPRLGALGDEFYGTGVKRPPAGVIARADWLGIGVWYGDDGGCVCNNTSGEISAFRFHTNGFQPEEVDGLVTELRTFTGLPWRRYMQNGIYPIMTLGNSDGTPNNRGDGNLARWVEMVRPYVPPMLACKLRVDACGDAWHSLRSPEGEWAEETTVKSVKPYTLADHEDCLVFDLVVEGHHSYVVHGVLVSDAATASCAPLELPS